MTNNERTFGIQYDDGSGEHETGYYIVDSSIETDLMGPLTSDELRELRDLLHNHVGESS